MENNLVVEKSWEMGNKNEVMKIENILKKLWNQAIEVPIFPYL